MLVCSLKSASASFPASFLLATHDGLTALLSFPVDSGSGHFLHKRREMSASLPSPSLKFGMTHVSVCSVILAVMLNQGMGRAAVVVASYGPDIVSGDCYYAAQDVISAWSRAWTRGNGPL